jgi:dihydroxy-acid dehydratase
MTSFDFFKGQTRVNDPTRLRSHRWFGPDDLRSFGHRSRLKGMGLDDHDFRDRPIVAILNTWNDLNTCHSHFKARVEEVRRGILQSGGYPVEIPVMSLGEMMMKPTTMFYRNLLAMEVEEVLRCHPVDAAVLMGGCDKTVPAMLMGAVSANIPAIFFPAGPMLKARWKKETLGSGSDAWKYWAERCAGQLCDGDWFEIENCIARSAGTCMTMGTASTMAAAADAMGFTLTGGSSIPAVLSEHSRLAVATGRRAVDLAWQRQSPDQILTLASLENGVRVVLAIGGSTNAIVHLIALAGRAGIHLDLDRFDQLSRETPLLANIRPAGKYLMEDFYDAGGLKALMNQLGDLLDRSCTTVSGKTLGEEIEGAETIDPNVIRPADNPLRVDAGTCVLRGNLAPDGCVIKGIAAEARLLKHRGPALVFDNYADMKSRINSDDLPVTADSVLVLRSAGPVGGPGMPEWGMLPIPQKLLSQGVRDMVRISDARMSGTSYGACVLHVSPESWMGGPLAYVEDGDLIELDVEARRIHWHVSDEELARRKAKRGPIEPRFVRGYGQLYESHVQQSNHGCDFDFLRGKSPNQEPDIY